MLRAIPATLMRGGTSKGLYFHVKDLPRSASARDRTLLAAMGSPDPRQIDGVGGAHPLTSLARDRDGRDVHGDSEARKSPALRTEPPPEHRTKESVWRNTS